MTTAPGEPGRRGPPIRLDRVVMDGPRSRLVGRCAAWPCEEAISIEAGDGALVPVPLRAAHAPIAAFDVALPLDLARTPLSTLRVRAGGDLVPLPPPGSIDAARLGADETNGAHIVATLRARGRRVPPPAAMMDRFESLGDNCEFGVFLRHFDALRPSLFRLGATGEYDAVPRAPSSGLSAAIAGYFDGLAERDDLEIGWRFGEWMATSRRYGFVFHTGERDPATDPASVAAPHARRVRLAIRTFVERAADPDTVFVRKSNGHEGATDLRAHLASLRAHGRARLLWVDLAPADAQSDVVSLLGDGLVRATLPAMQPYDDAERPDRLAWLRCVRDAWMMIEGVAAVQDPPRA